MQNSPRLFSFRLSTLLVAALALAGLLALNARYTRELKITEDWHDSATLLAPVQGWPLPEWIVTARDDAELDSRYYAARNPDLDPVAPVSQRELAGNWYVNRALIGLLAAGFAVAVELATRRRATAS